MNRDVLRIIVDQRLREIRGDSFDSTCHPMIIEACVDILAEGDMVLICDAIVSRIKKRENAK